MINFQSTYFDGKSSKAHSVDIVVDEKFVRLRGNDSPLTLDFPLQDCEITPPLGDTPRSLMLANGTRCETADQQALVALEQRINKKNVQSVVHFIECRWKLVTSCLTGLILCIWVLMNAGIPFLAEKAAYSIPPEMMETISRKTLEVLDNRFLEPSEINQKRIAELQHIFAQLRGERNTGFNYRLSFRKSPQIGPNAFALPSGVILMTDELVNLAENDRELLGILVHEMAHVDKRHGLRGILQSAGVFMLISAIAGDVVSITSTAATLPTLLAESGYSRKFEREADQAAGQYFIRKGWGTKSYQDILLRLSKKAPQYPEISFLSTHPETKERIKRLQALEKQQTKN